MNKKHLIVSILILLIVLSLGYAYADTKDKVMVKNGNHYYTTTDIATVDGGMVGVYK